MRRILGKIVVLLFFVLAAPSTADIKSMKIRSHGRDQISLSRLDCPHTAYLSIAVSSVNISSILIASNYNSRSSSQPPHPDPSRIGFFLLPRGLDSDLFFAYIQTSIHLCPFDLKDIPPLFTFRDLSPPPPHSSSSFNNSYHVNYPGDYSLQFVNCNQLSLVSMDVRTQVYCTEDDGITRDYSSAPQLLHPSLYFTLFILYLSGLVF